MKYKALKNFDFGDGKAHMVGDIISVNPGMADLLMQQGLIEALKQEKKEALEPSAEPVAEEKKEKPKVQKKSKLKK